MVSACCIATQKQLEEGSNSIHVFVQLPKLRLNLNGSFVRDGDMLPYLPRVLQLPKLRLNLNGSFVRDGAMLWLGGHGPLALNQGCSNALALGAILSPPTKLVLKFDLCIYIYIYIDPSLIFDPKIYTLSLPPPKYLQITPMKHQKKKKKIDRPPLLPNCPKNNMKNL